MFKHRLKKRVFDKNQKCYRDIIVHTNARFGSDVLDNNGVEIFEGDKVKALTPSGDREIGVVYFDTGTFMWRGSTGLETELDSGGIYELEVIEEDSNADAHSQN